MLSGGSNDYVTGPDGLPIEQISEGSATFLYQDQLGSTRGLIDASGAVVGSYTYSAYGTVTSHTGSASTPFQYAGQYTDSESGLQYLRARYYDPSTAQFLTVDPLVDLTGQAYVYTAASPLSGTDPTGLRPAIAGQTGPTDPCPGLAQKIQDVVSVLKSRYQDMLEDGTRGRTSIFENHYYKDNPHPTLRSWEGHVEQFEARQTQLGKLLERYYDNGCDARCGDQTEAEYWWDIETAPAAPQSEVDKPPVWLYIVGGGAAVVGCILLCPELAAGAVGAVALAGLSSQSGAILAP